MSVVMTLPWGRELTVDDLDAMPEDGHRYELIDGALIVTPAPTPRHQDAVGCLYRVLLDGCPPHLRVYFAPLDVRLSAKSNLQPDLLVARAEQFTEKNLPTAPMLAVEVLSTSTRHIDLGLKRSAYETLGTPSYWVIDPLAPSITAWELRDGEYVEAGRAVGDEELVLDQPFPVRIVPARLLR